MIYSFSRFFFGRLKTDYKQFKSEELSTFLIERLHVITSTNPNDMIIILLDSLDQLQVSDYKLDWFITSCPKNVKIVYSTLTNHGDILQSIRNRTTIDESNYLEIKQLDISFALSLIDKWLNQYNRKISVKQRDLLEDLFNKAQLYPLYVKLTFDVISKWSSTDKYNEYNNFSKCLDIDKLVEYIFHDLEDEHGQLLVQRCMYYLTCFETGISEAELEDVLSVDNDVLEDLFEKRDPPICRFPISVWTRIKQKINSYLTEKQVDNTQVISWYHRKFHETARRLYINGPEISKTLTITALDVLTVNVLEVFMEKWVSEPKPFSNSQRKQARRLTGRQPFEYKLENGRKEYNMRKINCILSFTSKLYNREIATQVMLCDAIYLNYMFMHSNFSRRFDVFEFFSSCFHKFNTKPREKLTKEEQSLFESNSERSRRTTRSVASIFIHWLYQTNMDLLYKYTNAIAYIINSRLLMFYGICKEFTRYINDCDRYSLEHCALVTPYAFLPYDSAGVFPYENYDVPVKAIQWHTSNEDLFLLCDKIYGKKLKNAQRICEINLHDLKDEKFFNFIIQTHSDYRSYDTAMIVLCSKRTVHAINFNGKLLFQNKYENLDIKSIFDLGSFNICILFENQKYVQVLNHQKQPFNLNFDSNVNEVVTNLPKNFIIDRNFIVNVAFILDSNELHFYTFSKSNENLELRKVISFKNNLYQSCMFSSYEFNLCVTFKDGTCLFIDYQFNEFYVSNAVDNNLCLEIVQKNSNISLFKNLIDSSFYVYYQEFTNQWLKIPGYYEQMKFYIGGENEIFVGYDGEIVDIYYVKQPVKNENIEFVKLVDAMSQIGKIKYMIIPTQNIIQTISPTGRVFRTIIKTMVVSQHQSSIYHKSKFVPTSMCQMNDEHVISYSKSSGYYIHYVQHEFSFG